jgi:hypothetical protein
MRTQGICGSFGQGSMCVPGDKGVQALRRRNPGSAMEL